jgi:hypothetical protein
VPEERDVHVARLFEVLDDVDVPDVWEAIMARVDTEPTAPTSHVAWYRRWWPLLAAAAVLVVVAVVVYLRLADDSQTVDVPPVPADGASNTLDVTLNGAELDVEGSLVAGTVSIAVRNIGDGLHAMAVGRLVDGKTLEDARNALASAGPDVADPLVGIVEYPSALSAFGAVRGPGDASTITVSGVEAGEYVLGHVPLDNAGRPVRSQAGVQSLTIAAGDSGPGPAADVTYTVRADDQVGSDPATSGLDGPATLPAGPTTIDIVDDTGTPSTLTVFRIIDGETIETVVAFFDSGGAPLDWSHAPIDWLTSGSNVTDGDQMIFLDLTPGQWVIEKGTTPAEPAKGLHVTVS